MLTHREIHISTHKPACNHTHTGWRLIRHLLTHPSTNHLLQILPPKAFLLKNIERGANIPPCNFRLTRYRLIKSPFQPPLDEEEIGFKVTSPECSRRGCIIEYTDMRLSLSQEAKKKQVSDWPVVLLWDGCLWIRVIRDWDAAQKQHSVWTAARETHQRSTSYCVFMGRHPYF